MNCKTFLFGIGKEQWSMKQHFYSGCIQTILWVVLFLLWNTILRDVYPFSWMEHNEMYWLWFMVPLCCLTKRSAFSLWLTMGNLVGLFAGWLVGDILYDLSQLSHPEAPMHIHHGWTIWLMTLLLSTVIYAFVNLHEKTIKRD